MITYQIEEYEKALPELKEIFLVHWLELALFQDEMPLYPIDADYITMDRNGSLFLSTIRYNGELIGYYVCKIYYPLHYGTTLAATMDMLYTKIEYRGRGYAVRLLNFVEKELIKRGVKIWYSGFKTDKPLGLDRVLKKLNFKNADTYLAKWIG